jgi:hypothetical protein
MRVGRLVFEEGAVWWFGPCHTYRLWPRCEKRERENW